MRASAGTRAARPALILLLLAASLLSGCAAVRVPTEPASRKPVALIGDEEELALPLPQPLLGDLDQMLERRQIRILVPYNRTNYFIDKGVQRGTVVDAAQALEPWFHRKYAKGETDRINVVLFPTTRDLLLPTLQQGLGDIAAGSLTITPDRKALVDFSEPLARNIRELVVTGPGAPELHTLDDLGGQEVHVRRSSSFWEHLAELNAQRKAAGKREIVLRAIDEELESEDILEMVNSGLLSITVADDFLARFWQQILDGIRVREDLVVHQGSEIAWAVRKGSPLLLAELNAFVRPSTSSAP
jgi:membrane-bound lytic murein transglycosylase MltF